MKMNLGRTRTLGGLMLAWLLLGLGGSVLIACQEERGRGAEAMEELRDEAGDAKDEVEDEIDDAT
jgi:hypothetical protein